MNEDWKSGGGMFKELCSGVYNMMVISSHYDLDHLFHQVVLDDTIYSQNPADMCNIDTWSSRNQWVKTILSWGLAGLNSNLFVSSGPRNVLWDHPQTSPQKDFDRVRWNHSSYKVWWEDVLEDEGYVLYLHVPKYSCPWRIHGMSPVYLPY